MRDHRLKKKSLYYKGYKVFIVTFLFPTIFALLDDVGLQTAIVEVAASIKKSMFGTNTKKYLAKTYC